MKDEITGQEGFWLTVLRMNQAEQKHEIILKRKLGRLEVTFNWRSKANFWGRFGGGWNWIIGFEAGGNTVIFNLLICSVRLHWVKRTADAAEDKR